MLLIRIMYTATVYVKGVTVTNKTSMIMVTIFIFILIIGFLGNENKNISFVNKSNSLSN